MMKRKLTDREKRILAGLHERLIPLVTLETWADKTGKSINKIRRDNTDVGGPDLRKRDFTKEMAMRWEMGQDYLGKSSTYFSYLSNMLRKKIDKIVKQGKKIDPNFDPTRPY